MSGASERANGRASGPVLQSVFLVVLAHSTASAPIVLQHFPLYRENDALCSEPDEAPPLEKEVPFKEKWDCISQESTRDILRLLDPRLVISGHTHHGCLTWHRAQPTLAQ